MVTASSTVHQKIGPPSLQYSAVVQVLGSGGPMHGEGRGSAAYVLWVRQRPVAVIDMGGDTPTALVRAGVGSSAVDILLLTHFHADHVSGLPDFLWGEMTANRKKRLTILGPDGGDGFADVHTFLNRLFGVDGAFGGMQGLLDGSEFELDVHEISTKLMDGVMVLERDDFKVFAYPVSHGKAPTIAYRIDGPDFRVVFGSDQTAHDPGFSSFAADADLLVLHGIVIDAAASDYLARVVALPSDLGLRAREARAKRVVLGHLMKATAQNKDAPLWSLTDAEAVRSSVATAFGGQVNLANDLECFPFKGNALRALET